MRLSLQLVTGTMRICNSDNLCFTFSPVAFSGWGLHSESIWSYQNKLFGVLWLLQHLQHCRYDWSSHSRWGFNCLKPTTTHVQRTYCFIFGLVCMFTCQTTEKVIQIVKYTNHIWEEIKSISTLSPLQNFVWKNEAQCCSIDETLGGKKIHIHRIKHYYRT